MSKELHELLKESGYLDSPANRFFWKNASPTFRNHLRQWFILSSYTAIPFAALLAILTRLKGVDRLVLFATYWVLFCLGFVVLDLVLGLAVRSIKGVRIRSAWLNWTPIPLAMMFLFFWGYGLQHAIDARPHAARLLIWAALAISTWIAGKSCQLLFVSRLYWHGISPPELKKYPLIMSLALLGMIGLHISQHWEGGLPNLKPEPGSPMLVLALDAPHDLFDAYSDLFPAWPARDFEMEETDITNFWTELGTGTPASLHQTSLVVFKTPFFKRPLNRRDPTTVPLLSVFQTLGLASPMSEGGRFRQYFWEILDDYQLRTFAYSWWHSFPASSRNGGVLSERWTRETDQHPFQVGLATLEPVETLPDFHNPALAPTVQRENQTWAQLHQRAENLDFDLCVAYLPLADLLENEDQEAVLAFRKTEIDAIFNTLPRDTRIIVLLSSGKPTQNRLEYRIISNWLDTVANPLESHLELAPTILTACQLPPDILMAPSRIKIPLDITAERVDYGEPDQDRTPDPNSDQNYFQELRSLGYVK